MSAAQTVESTTAEINILEVAPAELLLVTDKQHPLYDKRVEGPPDQSLVASMRQHGWRGEVQVVPSTAGLLVVAGRRRVKAAIAAGIPLIRAEVLPPAPVETLRWMISENEIRQEDDRFELARKVAVFMETFVEAHRPKGADGEPNPLWEAPKKLWAEARRHAREATGRSESRFSDLLALNKLAPQVKRAILSGQVSETAILVANFQTMSHEMQIARLNRMLNSGRTTRSAVMTDKKQLNPPPKRAEVMQVAELQIPLVAQQALNWAFGIVSQEEAEANYKWLAKAKKQLNK